MDLNLVLRTNFPSSLMDKSASDEKRKMEWWERSHCMCLMIMKKIILEAFRGTITDRITKAKEFFVEIKKRFDKNEKVEISAILTSLISMKYKCKCNIKQYIISSCF